MGRGNDFVLCTHPCIRSAVVFNVAATRNGLDRVGIFASANPTDRLSFGGSLELPFLQRAGSSPSIEIFFRFKP